MTRVPGPQMLTTPTGRASEVEDQRRDPLQLGLHATWRSLRKASSAFPVEVACNGTVSPTRFAQDFWNTRNYVSQAQVGAIQGGAHNETHFDDPTFTKLIAAASEEVDVSPGSRQRPADGP
ncbi:MAG: hypothetical protein ACR2FG_03060 [Marmoricola sp.]